MNLSRLQFLCRLPVLLNSSLNTRQVIARSIALLRDELQAEAATVFLADPKSSELVFWTLEGGDQSLSGKRIPANAGIVGWVFGNGKPVIIADAGSDSRFFSALQEESAFQTRSLICVPMIVRGATIIGALEVLNKKDGSSFTDEDLQFAEQFAHHAALAANNSQLHEQAQSMAQKLAALDSRKQQIISVLAHEFGTPPNVITNSAEMLTETSLSDETRKTLGSLLLRCVARLNSLIPHVKELSLVTSDSLPVARTGIAVAPLFEQLCGSMEKAAAFRKVSLRIEVAPDVDRVLADETLLPLALKNLLNNAVRFTPDGGKVTLGAARSAGRVELWVEDTGIGIEETEVPLIFEKFYEAGNLLNHSSGTLEFRSSGLGLGLAVVKNIIEAHGSTVDINSVPGAGSRFSFRLNAA